jgi:hypothetical protein
MLADGHGQGRWQLDREHRRDLRRIDAAGPRCALGIPPGLPLRAPEPGRQLTGRLRHRNPSLRQVSGRVDTVGVLSTASTITSHAVNVLPDMSQTSLNTPRQFQPPVAQRDVKAEVAHCVGGVITPP